MSHYLYVFKILINYREKSIFRVYNTYSHGYTYFKNMHNHAYTWSYVLQIMAIRIFENTYSMLYVMAKLRISCYTYF